MRFDAPGGSAVLDPPYNALPSSWSVSSIGSADTGSSQKRFDPDSTRTRCSHGFDQDPCRFCNGLSLLRVERGEGKQALDCLGIVGQIRATDRLAQAVDGGSQSF